MLAKSVMSGFKINDSVQKIGVEMCRNALLEVYKIVARSKEIGAENRCCGTLGNRC